VVLLVGGGDGAGGLQDAVRAISRARLPVQLLVITGRNKRLYAYLQRTKSSLHVPARIFGFVQNMPEMMRASDVIVTKAGPGTISEALACNLPIVLSGYVPGQEEGNVDYVLRNDVGVMAYDSLELVDALRRLVKPGSTVMRRQLENAKRMSRPRASFDIAECILSFMPATSKSQAWQAVQGHKRRLMPVRSYLLSPQPRPHRRLPRMSQITFLKGPVVRRLPRLRTRGISNRFIRRGKNGNPHSDT
jgi:1,2-diacylglycerol 3-beta-galactosyltransferase